MEDKMAFDGDPTHEFMILGISNAGRQFRPSDWAERLSGVMACFRPEDSGDRNAHLKYSPYVRPTLLNGVRAVVVDENLVNIEPLAFHFVLNFARDNDLQIVQACLMPELSQQSAKTTPQAALPMAQNAQKKMPQAA